MQRPKFHELSELPERRVNLSSNELPDLLPPRASEQMALTVAEQYAGDRILCTSQGRGQAALALAKARIAAAVDCWYLDDHHYRLAREHLAKSTPPVEVLPPGISDENRSWCDRIRLLCTPDFPDQKYDLALIPLSTQGEAELCRDLMQAALVRLEIGGHLIVSVDNSRDRWVHEQLKELFDKVTVRPQEEGVVYVARKTSEPRKLKNFRCEFVFRDQENLIRAISRPGVFSHRHIDPGARQLIEGMQVKPHQRLLDIGCGSGVVGLALAKREPTVSVHAVDSNARAVACTLEGAALNELSNITAEMKSEAPYTGSGAFDWVIANPPYYAGFKIAETFLQGAYQSLRGNGKLLLVTKRPEWYQENLPEDWDNVRTWPSKSYHLVTAEKPKNG